MQPMRMVLTFLFSMSLTLTTGLGLVWAAGGQSDSPAGGYGADNTGRNVRDRSGQTVTPEEQQENRSDLDITAAIRRAVVKDDALSMNAHNVKIITRDGVVTLRGPVDSPDEKTKIDQLTRQVQGVKQVDNQLEVNTR